MKNLIKIGIIWLFLVITIILLFGCGPSYKLRKAQKLIKKAEIEGAVVKHDTIYKDKLIHIEGKRDTITQKIPGKDTIIYITDKSGIKIKEIVKHDTLKFYVQCPDSVLHEKEKIGVTNNISCPPENHFWRNWAIAVTGLLVIVIGIIVFRK